MASAVSVTDARLASIHRASSKRLRNARSQAKSGPRSLVSTKSRSLASACVNCARPTDLPEELEGFVSVPALIYMAGSTTTAGRARAWRSCCRRSPPREAWRDRCRCPRTDPSPREGCGKEAVATSRSSTGVPSTDPTRSRMRRRSRASVICQRHGAPPRVRIGTT